MKTQAKLYKEYQGWVERKNKVSLRFYKEWWKEYKKSNARLEKRYKMKLKKWESDNRRKIKEYESLPWFKRAFTTDPRNKLGFGWRNKPRDYSWLLTMPIYFSAERESCEGFMNWLVNKKYKL